MAFTLEKIKSRYGALAALGLPIVVGQIGNVVLGFADTLMVGHHSMEELAAASFVNTMFTLVVLFATGFSYGLTPVAGSLFGRGMKGDIGATPGASCRRGWRLLPRSRRGTRGSACA